MILKRKMMDAANKGTNSTVADSHQCSYNRKKATTTNTKSISSTALLCLSLVCLPSYHHRATVDAFVIRPSAGSSSKIGISKGKDIVKPIHLIDENALSSNSIDRKHAIFQSSAKSTIHTTSSALSLSNNNEEEEENDEEGKLKNKIKQSYKKTLTKVINFIPTLKVALSSFTVGIVLAFTIILVPVYNSVDKMSEPVTLFETILNDLDNGYVDTVDTKKLFETGVNAMLKSLDPYTEFEGRQEAKDMNEGISGKYAGVGLVISGTSLPAPTIVSSSPSGNSNSNVDVSSSSNLLPQDALNDNNKLLNDLGDDDEDLLSDYDDFDREDIVKQRKEEKRIVQKAYEKGVRVISAFEGYAFDAGMRPGDKIVAIDGWRIKYGTPVEDVRLRLRGEPGTNVDITFERDGVDGETTLAIPRNIVQIRDVKLTSFIGKPQDGIGYIQLTGFNANAGREVRSSIFALQQAAEEASKGDHSLKGLILDLRGNPGGLLTSAVDVSSLLVPKGSEIVSAKGRGFPGVTYKSRVDPILDPSTKLAVLINDSTASAAEIVSGAVQDLDVGVIIGSNRSFGKGLVQNVEELPFDTALKFTVAKYYTPSGRCIQSTNYKEGGVDGNSDGRYKASKVAEKDKMVFYTKNGREVKDGGGIAVDYKVSAPKASALEVTLLRSGVINDFASEWSKTNQITNDFDINDSIYHEFQNFVMKKQKDGDIKLDALYAGPIEDLQKALKASGYKGSTKEVDQLRASIMSEMRKDFDKYKKDIKEDIGAGILARYLPESMLIERSIGTDEQVIASAKLLRNENKFDNLLARDISTNLKNTVADSDSKFDEETGTKLSMKW